MNFKVLGCHGGETPKHRTCSFLVDDVLAVDAGSVCGVLSLEAQREIRSVLVSHSHMDHIRDLGTLVDNRSHQGGPTLEIVGIAETIAALRDHYFNGRLWPDFTKIDVGGEPAVRFVELTPGQPASVCGAQVTPILVDHTVDTSAFVIERNGSTIVYSGDTGPTHALWEHVNTLQRIDALLIEVSFPNDQEALAKESCHLTPATLRRELEKFTHGEETPVLLYHIKPAFEAQVLGELAQIRERNLGVLRLEDEFLF